MKIIFAAIAVALTTALSHGQDIGRVNIKTQDDVERIASIPEWMRGKSTNDLTVSVLVGTAHVGLISIPLYRELTFDAEGRLVHASKVSLMNGGDLRSELMKTLDSRKNRDSMIPRIERRAMREARELERRRRPVEK